MNALVEAALNSRDPEKELLRLAQGCTEWSCIYHGEANQALHEYRSRQHA